MSIQHVPTHQHTHVHSHAYAHAHGSLADENYKYWNAASQSVFEAQWVKTLQQQITNHLQANVGWIGIDQTAHWSGTHMKMLDYACGNGVPSTALASYFTKLVGIDLAEGMLEKYKLSLRGLNLSEDRFLAIQGDLIAPVIGPRLNTAELLDFDLVVICMALHHLEDPQQSIKRLVERLKPGGVMLVIDWAADPDDRSQVAGQYAAVHTVAHHAFSRKQMRDAFESAGCDGFDFVLHDETSVVPAARGGDMQLFFARGVKKDL